MHTYITLFIRSARILPRKTILYDCGEFHLILQLNNRNCYQLAM